MAVFKLVKFARFIVLSEELPVLYCCGIQLNFTHISA